MNNTLETAMLIGGSLLGIATISFGSTVYDLVNPLEEVTTSIKVPNTVCTGSMLSGDYHCILESQQREVQIAKRRYDLSLPDMNLGLTTKAAVGNERFQRVGSYQYTFHNYQGKFER